MNSSFISGIASRSISTNSLLVILLFSRFFGFFVLSPLFLSRGFPFLIRLGCSIACALLLIPLQTTLLDLGYLEKVGHIASWIVLNSVKEILIGFLLGFIIHLIFEGVAFSGQIMGALMGFSATEVLDPNSNTPHPLIANLLSLSLFTLFLAMDLHHVLLRFLYDSFDIIPLKNFYFSYELIDVLLNAMGSVFSSILTWLLYPLLIFLLILMLFALLSRFFPIFWIGFPLLQIAGFLALIGASPLFSPILEHLFWRLVKNFKLYFG